MRSRSAGSSTRWRLPTICWRALRDKDQQELNLFTHYHVPDRAPTPVLIGFQRPTERDFFRKLLTVDSMGVTKAQRALAASVSTIARWIEAGDRRALSGLPGIGLRQADKIIAELRGKLVEEALLQDEGFDGADAPATTRAPDQVAADTVDALIGLGYQRRQPSAGSPNSRPWPLPTTPLNRCCAPCSSASAATPD